MADPVPPPRLLVRSPGQPDQTVAVGAKPLVVGRGEDCEVWIPEKKASRRHARVVALEEGGWVVEDLGSANGTFVGERRVMRIGLEEARAFRIGDTTVTLETGDVAGAPAPAPAEPAVEIVEDAEPPPETDGPARIDVRILGRSIALALLALLLGVGVELFLGARAREERAATDARADFRAALQRMDVSSLDQIEDDVRRFRVQHPSATEEAQQLDRWLDHAREKEQRRVKIESRLNALVAGQGTLPESEVRAGLLALRRENAADADLAARIDLALAALDRRGADAATQAVEEAARRAALLTAERKPGAALRALHALRAQWPAVPAAARDVLVAAEEKALEAAKSLEQDASAAAEREADPDRRRALLAAAWEGLEGTPQGDRLAETLRFAQPTRPAAARPTAGGTAPAPTAAPLPTDVLARAAEAEKWFLMRRWPEARVQFVELMGKVPTGLLHDEWNSRVGEIDRLLGLVADLEAATKAGPVRRKLQEGNVVVTGATPQGVSTKDAPAPRAWSDVSEKDVVPLLAPEKPTVEQRLSTAVLAMTVNDREALVRTLLPLYEAPPGATADRTGRDQADRMIARYLYGRPVPPEGGYRAYRGELLDAAGYLRKVEAERLDGLHAKAEELLAKVSADPAFHKLEKMRELRDALDKARRYALVAIFDETHWPYPYQRGSQPYQVVTQEVLRRVDLVRKIWEDPLKAKVARTATLEKTLSEWTKTIAELSAAKQDVTGLEARMAPYASYATGEAFTVRTFFRDESERELLEYNRWVMDTYNPSRTTVATEGERKQTQITNEYRMMMGYTISVTPGPAPYDSLTKENVQTALDQNAEASPPVPLRAVRIDDRLVKSARGHSQDMTARSFFDHFAPPNPATGEGKTSPFDRMKKQGYEGGAASENIAQAGDPQTAHDMWLHSSGHHRNIVSSWIDQGVGFAGHSWTQNFGAGGGDPPAIPGKPVPTTPSGEGEDPASETPPADPGQDPPGGR